MRNKQTPYGHRSRNEKRRAEVNRRSAARAPRYIQAGCLSKEGPADTYRHKMRQLGRLGAASEGVRLDPASDEFAAIAARYNR